MRIGVTSVTCIANTLEGVNDHQRCVGVLRKKVGKLYLQSLSYASGNGGKVQRLRCIIRDLKQAALDTGETVLQTEVEHSAAVRWEVPHV